VKLLQLNGSSGGNTSIFHTVDSTGAFRVAGVATTDVPDCTGFFFLISYLKSSPRKSATKIFDISVLILDVRVCLSVYLPLQKIKTLVFYNNNIYLTAIGFSPGGSGI
jgi:hypothetical protein